MFQHMYDFCGIGNACVDIVSKVDDAFLAGWQFEKSICTYLTLDRADALEASLETPSYIPGGCGANTASCVTALGGSSAFIGRVAADAIGQRFLADMKERGIRYTGTPDTSPGAGSTRIFALLTPDAERTFAAFYGVQEDLSERDLDEEAIAKSKFMYLDGYALNSRRGGETFLAAAAMSHTAKNKVVFSPSDLSILNKYPSIVAKLVDVSDIIVCNEQEARHLSRSDDIHRSIAFLRGIFECGAVTTGERGVYVFDRQDVCHVPAATPPGPVTDTNGAGDGFAGGFLFGLARGLALSKAAALGNRCAADIITHAGARPVRDFKAFLTE